MQVIAYTVHEPEALPGRLEERADRLRLVKEGFCWPALLIPLLWLLYHRMWLVLLGFLLVVVIAEVGLSLLGADELGGWVAVSIGLLLAMHANDLRRWTLARRGYRMTGAVTGRDIGECEYKLFSTWEPEAPTRPAHERKSPPLPPSSQAGGGDGPVIGFLEDPLR